MKILNFYFLDRNVIGTIESILKSNNTFDFIAYCFCKVFWPGIENRIANPAFFNGWQLLQCWSCLEFFHTTKNISTFLAFFLLYLVFLPILVYNNAECVHSFDGD